MKRLKIPCECSGKCGKIDIRPTSDPDEEPTVEINWYEGKKCVAGVFIGEEQIKKIIKY